MSSFQVAKRAKKKLRLALCGPAGSGKTYGALRTAYALGNKVFVIDTEHGSATLYAGETVDGKKWEFNHVDLQCYTVDFYLSLLKEAEAAGADVVIIDSLSHAWDSSGGILEKVDLEAMQKDATGKEKGSFRAWGKGTTLYKSLMDGLLASKCHLIVTMRTKTEYNFFKDEKGKTRIEKIGTKPIQRDGIDYEFDLVFDLDTSHAATISKTRCKDFEQGAILPELSASIGKTIAEWLNEGDVIPEKTTTCETLSEPVPSPPVPSPPAPTSASPPPEPGDSFPADAAMWQEADCQKAREKVRQFLQHGVITPAQLKLWKDDRQLAPQQELSGMELQVLLVDIEDFTRTGVWAPTMPF